MDKSNDLAAPASVGEAFIAHLAARGVDYFFGNAGTDFPRLSRVSPNDGHSACRFPAQSRSHTKTPPWRWRTATTSPPAARKP